ncbi:MAG: hypothetical protein ACRD6W_19435 [Nitrososphaerales archaeon]
MGTEGGAVEVPAKIADGGLVVRDRALPIRAFIEGNVTFQLQLQLQLQLHFDQLNRLRS